MLLRGALKTRVRSISTTSSSTRPHAVYGGELGSFRDNESFFFVAKGYIENGEVEAALQLLERLREHIQQTSEPKSVRCLLPAVENLLNQRGAFAR
ncbi:hypothetical protein HY374_02585 [Candidatus Berkelbacteria bacterium]|nr:hypothetical protein [Candidatus Berkelbacteria bacterium]